MEYPMADEKSNAKSTDRGNIADQKDQRSQTRTQQDNVDMQPNEGQPEIPKVGSRDAPGG
jgi:hypothetical protein